MATTLLLPLRSPLPKLPTSPLPHPTIRSTPRFLRLRCTCSSSGDSRAEGVVSSMVDELLKREENRDLMEGLEEASQRVERAREALADIERQEAEASKARSYVRQLEKKQSEIAETQRELVEARAMVEEAQRSLSSKVDGGGFGDGSVEEIDRDRERLESAKAGVVSAIVGSIASLPISFYQATSIPQLLLESFAVFISCALFGVTFRYAVRRDIDDVHLKTGAAAAFGFVRGLAAVDVGKALELDTDSLISLSVDGAVHVAESTLIFFAAAIALDFCFKMRFLSPFPMRK
ncbi:uncharacterized protein [Typha latifolia]|uniref:uncharacterized protein n=1 Tax=Typha latifolia TaxID=4733 RepID=UPI003C2C2EFF